MYAFTIRKIWDGGSNKQSKYNRPKKSTLVKNNNLVTATHVTYPIDRESVT